MNKKSEYIKSPLNYTGNKHRLLDDIISKIPKNTKSMLDLFCGGTSVGLNSNLEEVIFIDSNVHLINLLKFLKENSFEYIIKNLEKYIKKYNLTNSYRNTYKFYKEKISEAYNNNGLSPLNKNGYVLLRRDYNELKNKNTKKANTMLYLLMLYAFNNDFRFNRQGEFNLPVGKTDLNTINVNKLEKYSKFISDKNFKYLNLSFEDKKTKEIIEDVDFIYIDPPYLITTAVYNETGGWTPEKEVKLLSLLSELIANNKNFILSNVLRKGERCNVLLKDWLEKNKEFIEVEYLDINYKSASYNKKDRNTKEQEIIVYNKNLIIRE